MNVTSIRSFLSPAQLEVLAGSAAMMIGSLLSPAWPVLNAILDPLVRIMMANGNPVLGYMELVNHFQAMSAQDIFFTVQLPLILLAVFQLGFIILSYRLGVYLVRQVAKNRAVKAS